jgi:predicted RNase H-like HicB family nuclease
MISLMRNSGNPLLLSIHSSVWFGLAGEMERQNLLAAEGSGRRSCARTNFAVLRFKHMMNELIFLVEEAPEGGYFARALEVSIFTQAETEEELKANVREAAESHYGEGNAPKIIRLHFVREEVISG